MVTYCRYRVIYRLVGGVYLMVVARPEANVFWMLNLSSVCVRLLVTVSKGVEVMPNKLAKFYPEVWSLRACFLP